MKVLEDTPAVLSLGKLCDENGYSYEWINGQKPHLIKNGIRIQCNTENFVPIVVPGLSSSSSSSSQTKSMTSWRQEIYHPTSSSSSSTSPTTTVLSDSETREREDLSGIDSHPVPVSSSYVEEMIERGDPLLPKLTKNPKPNKDETTIERGDPCHSESPEWLQEFREESCGWKSPERRDSHASSSHELSLEPASTRSEDLGKHRVCTHFPKDRNCEICQRTKITRAPCRRSIGRVVPRAKIFGDLITADHNSSQWRLWISKQSPICSLGARLGHPMDPVVSVQNKNFTGNSKKVLGARIGSLKSFTLTIAWNLAKPEKIFPGIIVRRHHTDRKQMRLPKERCAEWKKVRLQYCCNQVWMKNGGQIPWKVTAICETCKISCLMGRHHTRGALENHSKDRSFRLIQWLSIIQFLFETKQEFIKLERKSNLDCSSDTLCTRGEFGRVT